MTKAFQQHDEFVRMLGENVAFYRKNAGFTQEQVAETLGLSIEQVSRIERGKSIVNITRLKELAELYSCPISSFFKSSSPEYISSKKHANELLSELDEKHLRLTINIIQQIIDSSHLK